MKPWIAAFLILLAGPAVAQQHQHGQPPYVGLEQRDIKALSDQQIADLRAVRTNTNLESGECGTAFSWILGLQFFCHRIYVCNF
jgi:hypothetical protein